MSIEDEAPVKTCIAVPEAENPYAHFRRSYAQNFEDLMLWRALGHVEHGFFIDVGAQDPLVDSVSKMFSINGWQGIHVEPTPCHAQGLRHDRPNDMVIEAAVGTHPGDLHVHYFPGTGLSTGNTEMALSHEAKGFVRKDIVVPCLPLAEVLEQAAGRPVHWLKIDVECMEADVLQSWGQHPCRPWLIVVEAVLPFTQQASHEEWEHHIVSRGYEFVYFDGLNRFYCHKEHPSLRNSFAHGPCVLDGVMLSGHNTGFTPWVVWKYTHEVECLQAQVADLQERLASLKHVKNVALDEPAIMLETQEYSRGTAMSEGYTPISKCRVSGSDHLVSVLNLGHQDLTGVFPRSKDTPVTRGPLELVWCPESNLVQLGHSYNLEEMYGENYGYRSGLNKSMVRHLTQKIHGLESYAGVQAGDVVLDIGSNDSTSLQAYQTQGLTRIGIDPTGMKFKEYYPDDIHLVPDFFSAQAFRTVTDKQAKVVTSISMFYDLEDPIAFSSQVAEVLAEDGVWHFEQSYMPSMLRLCSYDTICHEHLEYYSLNVVRYILDRVDMKVVDVRMNSVNGGSFAVTAARRNAPVKTNDTVIQWLLEQEEHMGLHTPAPYRDFEERVFRHRADLSRLLKSLAADGKKVLGYGASTKGNVVLQFCGITENEVQAIAEVNPDKFGAYTPGTHIPIISEEEARAMKPDYFLVLPWHFKEGILQREAEYLHGGGKMIFPFPEIEII